VHALADRLQDLDVDGRRRAVVPVVLELRVAADALRALARGEGERRLRREAGHDRARVEGEDGRVRVDRVWVQDLRERERREHGHGQVRRERVLVRAARALVIACA
jgi:hypothetical protein